MRNIIGIIGIVIGILVGFFVGIYWGLIGGLIQMFDGFKSVPLNSNDIAWGFAKFLFGTLIGEVIAGIIVFISITVLIKNKIRKKV